MMMVKSGIQLINKPCSVAINLIFHYLDKLSISFYLTNLQAIAPHRSSRETQKRPLNL